MIVRYLSKVFYENKFTILVFNIKIMMNLTVCDCFRLSLINKICCFIPPYYLKAQLNFTSKIFQKEMKVWPIVWKLIREVSFYHFMCRSWININLYHNTCTVSNLWNISTITKLTNVSTFQQVLLYFFELIISAL